MTKPASELIALAVSYEVRANANRSCRILADEYATVAQALRTAASLSGSERAGVDALREALKPFAKMAGAMYVSGHCGGASPEDWPDRWHVTVQGGEHFHTPQQHGGYLIVADFRRAAEALATPPAQPAPVNIHGKPDGAVRSDALADLYYAIGGLAALAAIGCDEVGRMTGDHVAVTQSMERRRDDALAALRSPRIAAAETSPGDVLAMKEACKKIAQPWPGLSEEEATSEIDKAVISVRNRIAVAIDRLDVKAEAKSEAVQDTWFTDSRLPVVAMSGDVESDHVLKLHFRRPVTDQDRIDLTDALNMKICAEANSQEPDAVAWRFCVKSEPGVWSYSARQPIQHSLLDIEPLYAHPTTKPEAPAVSVDAIRGMIRKHVTTDLYGCLAGTKEAATAIAALFAGGR